jgi:hypothetical protein
MLYEAGYCEVDVVIVCVCGGLDGFCGEEFGAAWFLGVDRFGAVVDGLFGVEA